MTGPARVVSRGLAGVLAELELTQPTVVSLSEVGALAARVGLKTPPAVVADRLRRRGWLLPTGQRGMYEFAPGAHAGPYGHGDPFLTFRAARSAKPFDASIALQSALWLHGLSDRAPDKHELAAAPDATIPDSVKREMRVVRFRAQAEPTVVNGLPVHQAASVLVHLASKPGAARNWPAFAEALAALVALATSADGASGLVGADVPKEVDHQHGFARRRNDDPTLERLRIELAGRSQATRVRLAYLISGVTPGLADWLQPRAAPGVVYFGPRRPSRRFSARFNVADTLLPFDPEDLAPMDGSG